MIILTTKDDKIQKSFPAEGQFSFFIAGPKQINLEFEIFNKEGGLGLNSEWLGFKTESTTRIRWPQFKDLEIQEDNRTESPDQISIQGSYADELQTDDNGAFYYYVRQALQPLHSWTRITYLKENLFHVQHKSEIQFYDLEISATIPFTGLAMHIWKDPTMAIPEDVLMAVFDKKFDRGEYLDPVIEENDRIKKIRFPARF